jgi:phosphohistidine swiveling domain-containing protein
MANKELPPFGEGVLSNRYIYSPGVSPDASVGLIGAKAFHLTELQHMGMPTPPFIVMTTNGWKDYYKDQRGTPKSELPADLHEQLINAIPYLEKDTEKHLGDKKKPLFVSVRSGAPSSMPGAMHTILNVGITDKNIEVLEKRIGRDNAQYAYFTLIRSLGTHVYGIPDARFKAIRDARVGHDPTTKPDVNNYVALVKEAKKIYEEYNAVFPEDPWDQLAIATDSVYRSWDSEEAADVRRTLHIPDDLGTAVTIQEMVWGNSNQKGAGSGVMFTRDPTTGKEDPIAVFAAQGQGPKVVGDTAKQLDTSLSQVPFRFNFGLKRISRQLSRIYQKPQEVEFTIDGQRLWILQTRSVPMSTLGEFRFLMDRVKSKLVSMEEAQKSLSLEQLHRLLVPELDLDALELARKSGGCLGEGVALSPGWATGKLVTSIEQARRYKHKPVILYADLSPKDLRELPPCVKAVISRTGSIGSHKARAATRLDSQGVVAIFGVHLDLDGIEKGSTVTVSGSTDEVFLGVIPTSSTDFGLLKNFERDIIAQWLEERRRNPWLFVSRENGINKMTDELEAVLEQSHRQFKSPKAHAIVAINAMMPSEIRIPYTVVIKEHEADVRQLVQQALVTGSDVTIRTCRYPDTRGTSPYAVITNQKDFERFFQDPDYTAKHGGWPRWLGDKTITEVVVGEIPKNKLNQKFYKNHCNWTLSCVGDRVYLQIVPGSPLLRSQEQVLPEHMITVEAQFDPNPSSINGIQLRHLHIGSELLTNSDRYAFLSLVSKTVLGEWWQKYNLALRMAAISEVFSKENFLTPGLEGQASDLGWGVKVYGVKLDEGDGDI